MVTDVDYDVLPALVLASASPRRLKIIDSLGIDPLVLVSDIEEIKNGKPAEIVITNSKNKARDIKSISPRNSLIIAGDTIVVKDGNILGKPKDEKEAIESLLFLSGQIHEVFSGLAILDNRNGKFVLGYSIAKVYFRNLEKQEILNYLKYAKPYDKAGSYGIQELGALLVERIEGNYGTVMGLSPILFAELLKELDLNIWQFIQRDEIKNKNRVK